jgi:deoxyribose-phosphate aldolase
MVKFARKELKGTNILVCTVISFPGGFNSLEDKMEETVKAITDGADEIDMVLDYQRLLNNWDISKNKCDEDTHNYLLTDIKQLADYCHKNGVILKVIVESGRLDNIQTLYVTNLCIDAKADYIKTSTGKVEVGAEIDKVLIMKNVIERRSTIENINIKLKIKASGGIRTIEDQREFAPYVDRFGMGFGSVDSINGLEQETESSY